MARAQLLTGIYLQARGDWGPRLLRPEHPGGTPPTAYVDPETGSLFTTDPSAGHRYARVLVLAHHGAIVPFGRCRALDVLAHVQEVREEIGAEALPDQPLAGQPIVLWGRYEHCNTCGLPLWSIGREHGPGDVRFFTFAAPHWCDDPPVDLRVRAMRRRVGPLRDPLADMKALAVAGEELGVWKVWTSREARNTGAGSRKRTSG